MRAWIVVWGWITIAACDRTDSAEPPDDPTPTEDVDGVDADYDGYITPADCDDTDADVHPGADERCNTIDDDCDGATDDDPVDGDPGFFDEDGDGFGDSALPLVSCTQSGWAPVGGDCADNDAARHPGVVESCNGVDDDCDQVVDAVVIVGGSAYDTIAAAVLAAPDDATLEVCDGVWSESGIVVDHNLTITSTSGDPALAVLDGSATTGSLFVVDGGDLVLEGFTIQGGTGTDSLLMAADLAFDAVAAGGAVNALSGDGGAVTIRSCVFTGNAAAAGGAIAASDLTIEDSTFEGNTAAGEDGWGGAVWVGPSGQLTVERTVFDSNSATYGGAVVSYAPTVCTDVEAVANHATVHGGFAWIGAEPSATSQNTLDLIATELHDNVADVDGGALYLSDASGTADAASEIHDNAAVFNGGGVRITTPSGRDASWDGGTISFNTADRWGGGLYLYPEFGGVLTVSNVVLEGNVAADDGSGLTMHTSLGSALVLSDSTLFDNGDGVSSGGALYLSGTFDGAVNGVFERIDVRDNSARYGGGFLLTGAVVEMSESTMTDNQASLDGGAAWLADSSVLVVTDVDFSGNLPNEVSMLDLVYTPLAVAATFTCDATVPVCF